MHLGSASARKGGCRVSWCLEALKKYFVLFNIIVGIVLALIDGLLGTFSSASNIGALSSIYSLAVTVRRLHDFDRTGWWIMIGLIPLIGGILLLVFAVMDGTTGNNRYDPNPKETAARVA